VESCTAIAENEDGSFELITWMQAEENPENIEQEEQIALPPFPMRAA
jgi:hypothetical protein